MRESRYVVEAPEAEAAAEGREVVAATGSGRELFHHLGVAAADDDVIGDERVGEGDARLGDGRPPRLLADAAQPGSTENDPEPFPLLAVENVAQLERHEDIIGDESRA